MTGTGDTTATSRLARGLLGEDAAGLRIEVYDGTVAGPPGAPFDAISSVGMFEHVGQKRLSLYFDQVVGLLNPGGRLLTTGASGLALRPRWESPNSREFSSVGSDTQVGR